MMTSTSRTAANKTNVRVNLPVDEQTPADSAVDPTAFAERIGYPWTPDLGDGTFQNPVLFADYSDPDVIRDGDDFYLVASSFNCTPGLPILHSHDLVNWTIVNHAVKNLPDPRGVYQTIRHGEGVWAPSIRKHDGKFWIFFPMPDEGIYVITANDPRGHWSPPHLLVAGAGLIDPCPLWDDDGKAYLVHAYAHSRCGLKHKLCVRPMSPDATRLLGDGVVVFDKPEAQPTLEGPKFLKRNGYYYILAPAGGVETGWQLALRSRHVFGPYEARVVLERGSTPVNGPHQGALVELRSGESWFIHFQDVKPFGRIVHLQPVSWEQDWPMMGVDHDGNGVGEPVARFRKPNVALPAADAVIPQTSDEFDANRLGLQWQWHANHREDWCSLTARGGWLRMYPQPAKDGQLADAANLLLQKFPAASFAVETLIEVSPADSAKLSGLIVMGSEHFALGVRSSGSQLELVFLTGHTGSRREIIIATIDPSAVSLRVQVRSDASCAFSYRTCDVWHAINAESCHAKEGVWIGAKVGLFSVTSNDAAQVGHADFDYFRFSAE